MKAESQYLQIVVHPGIKLLINVAEQSAGRRLHFLKRLIDIAWRLTDKI